MARQLIYTASQRCNYFFNTHMSLPAQKEGGGGGKGVGDGFYGCCDLPLRASSSGQIAMAALVWTPFGPSSVAVLQLINWQ